MRIWSHRGRLGALGPRLADNSLEALEAVVRAGVAGVEIDTWRLADGAFVLNHDREVAQGSLDTLRSDQVRQLPRLEAALDLLAGLEVNVELKVPPEADAEHQRFLGRELAERLASAGAGHPARLVASCFSLESAQALCRWGHNLAVGLLCVSMPEDRSLRLLADQGFWSLHCHFNAMSIEEISRLAQAGLAAVAWTVNDPARVRRLEAAGVEVVISDDPLGVLGPPGP